MRPPARFASKLSRGLVRVGGKDAFRFLQSLTTNDLHSICPPAPCTSSTAFLNGRGRVLFGAFSHRMDKNDYLLDVDERRTQALLKHLKLYRLRAKVDVDDVSHEHEVWSLVGVQKQDVTIADGLLCADPRLGALGLRAVVNTDFEVPAGVCVEEGKIFSMLRMLNGVPDGRDFDGEPLPLDLAFHMLNGVSFSKGCYLGQELTARTNFTGVLRKRITPFVVTDVGEAGSVADVGELICEGPEASVEAGTQLFVEGKKKAAGKVSSSMCNVGLAVLRFNEIFSEEGQEMAQMHLGDGRRVVAYKPTWWSEGGEEDVKANA